MGCTVSNWRPWELSVAVPWVARSLGFGQPHLPPRLETALGLCCTHKLIWECCHRPVVPAAGGRSKNGLRLACVFIEEPA